MYIRNAYKNIKRFRCLGRASTQNHNHQQKLISENLIDMDDINDMNSPWGICSIMYRGYLCIYKALIKTLGGSQSRATAADGWGVELFGDFRWEGRGVRRWRGRSEKAEVWDVVSVEKGCCRIGTPPRGSRNPI